MYITEEELQNNYINNLKYFETTHKNVFSKINALESAIAQGYYENKYDLVYKDSYFDILELSSNKHLYDSSSIEYANTVTNSINYKKDENLFKTFKNFILEHDKDYDNMPIEEHYVSGIAPVLKYINNNSQHMSDMKEINKFMFYGVGIGNHIMEVDKKLNSKLYLIIEDDLELFKLSMFVTPYYKLSKKAMLLFSVFDSQDEFDQISEKFLNIRFYDNQYLKYFIMLNHSEDKLKEFHIKLTGLSHNLFYYNNLLQQVIQPLDYLQNNYKFLNILHSQENDDLGQRPILFLAAGPSFKKNIKWIKENENKFLIIAVSAVLSMLEEENISPDIVTHIDGFKVANMHFKKIKSLDFLKNSIFLISARTQRNITDLFDRKNIFFFENATNYKKELGNLSAPCVGSISFLLLLALGVKEFYLLGLDLALYSKTGQIHSDGHELMEKVDLKEADSHQDNMSFRNTAVKGKGNFTPVVFSNTNFLLSAGSISSSASGFKSQGQNVYNLSDGIFFENTIPTHISDVDTKTFNIIDKTKLRESIFETFEINSVNSLTTGEYKIIKKYYKSAKKLKKLIEQQEQLNFEDKERFLSSIIYMYEKSTIKLNNQAPDLALVYQEYSKLIYQFIIDFFNTQGVEYSQKNMNNMNSILCKQFLKIVNYYIKKVEGFIEEDSTHQ